MKTDAPIVPVSEALPPEWEVVRAFFADGTHVWAVWTGKVWWSQGAEVFPERWQLLRRGSMKV